MRSSPLFRVPVLLLFLSACSLGERQKNDDFNPRDDRDGGDQQTGGDALATDGDGPMSDPDVPGDNDSTSDSDSPSDEDDTGDGDVETDTDLGTDEDPLYQPPALSTGPSCDAPAPIILSAAVTTHYVRLSSEPAPVMEGPCGETVAQETAGYFAFTLTEASLVLVGVASESPVDVALFGLPCTGDNLLNSCGQTFSLDLEAGTYVLGLAGALRTDLTLSIARYARPVEEEPTWPPLLAGADACSSAAPLLDLEGDQMLVRASLSGASASLETSTCTGASEVDIFYKLVVPARGTLTLAAASNEGVTVTLVSDGCGSTVANTVCGAAIQRIVDGGIYYVMVSGVADAAYELMALFEAIPPPSGTCDTPDLLALPIGTTTITGSGVVNARSSSCLSSGAEHVYQVTLDSTSTITISPNYSRVMWVTGSCQTGSSLACASYYDSRTIESLAAGTYYVIAEPYWSDDASYSVSITRATPPTRPGNDRCEGAIDLAFNSNNTASATYNFGGVVQETQTCGTTRHLYYRITLAEAARQLTLDTSYNANVELLGGSCGALSSYGCISYSSDCEQNLPAGTYYLRVGATSSSATVTGTVMAKKYPAPSAPSNDLCPAATPFDLSTGTATLTASFASSQNNMTLTGDLCSTSATSAREVFFSSSLSTTSDVSITQSYWSAIQAGLLSGSCDASETLGCTGSSYSSSTRWFYNVPPGPLLLVAEYTSTGSCVDDSSLISQLTVKAEPSSAAPSHDLCADAIAVALPNIGDAEAIYGTTRGAGDDRSSVTCPSYYYYDQDVPGSEVFYAVTLGERGVLKYSSTQSFTGQRVYVLGGCGDDGAFVCGTTSFSTGFALPAGTYIVVVDGSSDPKFTLPGAYTGVLQLVAP